jgi:Flp pilus assembly protein TadG
MALLSRLFNDRRGNVAVIFALALVPVAGAVGAALDYNRASSDRARLADALDAGVLAVGSQDEMDDAEAFDFVENWMTAHLDGVNDYTWRLESVDQDGKGGITAVAKGSVPMTLARVLGFDEVPITVTSEAVRSSGKIELALVLDNTGSMSRNDKIGKLRTAASDLVDTLVKAAKDPKDLKIALVPFSQTVKVGSTYKTADWLDTAGKSASAKSLFLGQTVKRLDLFTKMGTSWGGCVESRNATYESTDTTPDPNTPDTLYVPYFAPDEPDTQVKEGKGQNAKYVDAFNNNYLKDGKVSTIKSTLNGLGLGSMTTLPDFRLLEGDAGTKYTGKPKTGKNDDNAMGYQYGPNSGCEIAPLMRLSADSGAVKKAIGKMTANGNTDITMGLAWGWNTISPNGPFKDGVKYHDEEWQKYVVLMTDGFNQNEAGNADNQSLYSGIGYIWQGRMGITSGDEDDRTAARDENLKAMCQTMKDQGVVIFTVRVEFTEKTSGVLEACASDTKKFYEVANAADLGKAFKNIGESIQALRIAK